MMDDGHLRELQDRAENPPSLDEALTASKELVEVLGPLAETSPARYQVQLATAWKLRGAHLGLTEAQSEAEEAFATSVRLFREVATETNPETLVYLAIALHDLAHHQLKRDGGAQDALGPIEEAHAVCQRIASYDPESAQHTDASVCHLHAAACAELGDHQSAVAYAEQAETGLRAAERRDPELRSSLAETLRILGMSLMELQRIKEARKKLEDSAYLYRRLSKREPELFLGEFAHSTALSATILRVEGKEARAIAAYDYACDLYAKAAVLHPGFEDEYRTAVSTLIEFHLELGNQGKAEKVRRQHPI